MSEKTKPGRGATRTGQGGGGDDLQFFTPNSITFPPIFQDLLTQAMRRMESDPTRLDAHRAIYCSLLEIAARKMSWPEGGRK